MPKRVAGQGRDRKVRKRELAAKLREYVAEYSNVLIVTVDNVGSKQMQQVRVALRGKAVVLMGKNTLVRKVLREEVEKNPKLEALLPFMVGNIGLVFTNGNLSEVRKIIVENKVPAPARVGTLAQNDVTVPAGGTGLDPGQTAFFQTLNIATKIVKGAIEIVNDVVFLKKGEKISASHVALLDKLNIRPFSYGVVVTNVYEDGTVYSADILDMSQADLLDKFLSGVRKVAALSLGMSYPTAASLPYLVSNAFAKLVAISLATDYEFEEAKKFKDFLSNPGAFAAAAPAAAAGGAAAAAAPEVESEKEESEADMGFSLFD